MCICFCSCLIGSVYLKLMNFYSWFGCLEINLHWVSLHSSTDRIFFVVTVILFCLCVWLCLWLCVWYFTLKKEYAHIVLKGKKKVACLGQKIDLNFVCLITTHISPLVNILLTSKIISEKATFKQAYFLNTFVHIIILLFCVIKANFVS